MFASEICDKLRAMAIVVAIAERWERSSLQYPVAQDILIVV